jgi:hypothetical protein
MSAPELLAPVLLRRPPKWTWPIDQRVLAGGDRGQRQLRVRRGHAHGLHLGESVAIAPVPVTPHCNSA